MISLVWGFVGGQKKNLSFFTNHMDHIRSMAPFVFPVLTLTTAPLTLLPQLVHKIHKGRNIMPNSTEFGTVLNVRLLDAPPLIHSHL